MSEDSSKRSFTLKAVLLSILLAMLLAASNAYLILKIGTTISASIPAAVLAIGVFKMFKQHTIYECNLVQTAASAGEAIAASVAFIMPAMIIMHFWMHFDYEITTLTMLLGGILGVFLSIPLRRVLLSLHNLKYPEGTAVGNVLKISAQGGALLKDLLKGAGAGAIITFLQQGLQVFASLIPFWWQPRNVLMGISIGLNPAAFAAGFIIGPGLAISMVLGLIIGWGILLPIFSIHYGIPQADNAYDAVMTLWSQHLRYVGVGTMLVGGFWTLIKLIKPISVGMRESFKTLKSRHLVAEHERDMPMLGMGMGVLIFSILIFLFVYSLLNHSGMSLTSSFMIEATLITLAFIMIIGFLMTTVCGYVVGVVGSSNSPISSMIIMVVLLLGTLYLGLFDMHSSAETLQVTSLTLLVAAIIGAITTIAAENMQDLKAGQLIGATPWKQQIMLVVGVTSASLIIAPVFELLYQAYGIGGVFPRAGMDPSQMLSAPQAALISAIASGVFNHQLDWSPIILGGIIAILAILVDELWVRKRFAEFRLMILAIGFSIYLPTDVITALSLGGLTHYLLKRKFDRVAKDKTTDAIEKSTVKACGMVAGSSLMGVFLAIPFVIASNANVLTPNFVNNPHLAWVINLLGLLGLVFLMKTLLLKPKALK